MKKFLEEIIEKCKKEYKIVFLFLIVFLVFVIINIVINNNIIKQNEAITETLGTLTQESKDKIAQLSEEDEIKIYLLNYAEDDYVSIFAKKYEGLGKKIVVENKKTQEDEEFSNKYGIKDGYKILIISGDKSQIINEEDLYSYDYDTGNMINLLEQRLTNGIIKVSSIGKNIPIAILKGHEKYKLETDLSIIKEHLKLENYELKQVDLQSENIPEECNTIIISTQNRDFLNTEIDKIKNYINNGGNILWLEDAIVDDKDLPNLNSILDIYGVEHEGKGVICEQNKNSMIMQNPYIILPNINAANIIKDTDMPEKIMFYYSTKLNFANEEKLKELNIIKTELLYTSENALFKKNLSSDPMTKTEEDEEGRFVIGAMLEKKFEEKSSKLIIYANNYFITNQTMEIGNEKVSVANLYNNKEFIQKTIDYLTNNNDKIAIKKVVPRNYYIGIENESVKQAIIVETAIFVVLAVGIFFIKNKNK